MDLNDYDYVHQEPCLFCGETGRTMRVKLTEGANTLYQCATCKELDMRPTYHDTVEAWREMDRCEQKALVEKRDFYSEG